MYSHIDYFFHNRNSKNLFIIDSQHRLLGEIVNKKNSNQVELTIFFYVVNSTTLQ